MPINGQQLSEHSSDVFCTLHPIFEEVEDCLRPCVRIEFFDVHLDGGKSGTVTSGVGNVGPALDGGMKKIRGFDPSQQHRNAVVDRPKDRFRLLNFTLRFLVDPAIVVGIAGEQHG